MTAPRLSFRRLLIANRGEIALRIVRAAREHGLETVAVLAPDDGGSRHAVAADQCVHLPAGSGYSDIAALMQAVAKSGADALHPGYGFLAETPELAQACRSAKIVFIGPAPETIRLMGDKSLARQAMSRAGLAVIPGYDGEDQDDSHLAREARRVGYPLMIKACAGGGGRGMRRVESPELFDTALTLARSEARQAFGDDRVLLERAIDGARHIEFQLLADRFGQVIHLGERDCSIQRRHQKLIEEAPAPGVDPDTRRKIGESLVAAMKRVGYLGAGTIEMLLAPDGAWYFMEMNTRLQVEHPVTEAVFGEDIVGWQLRLAAGEPLAPELARLVPSGHAIEARLCAENPLLDFLPHSGVLGRWRPPEGIRVEHALADGVPVAPGYDSMLAKIVAYGKDRIEASSRLSRALGELVVLGVATNRDFLKACLAHRDFIEARLTTGFIDQHRAALLGHVAPPPHLLALAACLLLPGLRGPGEPVLTGSLQPLGHRFSVPLRLRAHGVIHEVLVGRVGAREFEVRIGESVDRLSWTSTAEGVVTVLAAGITEQVHFWRDRSMLWLASRAAIISVEDLSWAAMATNERSVQGDASRSVYGPVTAPTQARVSAVRVKSGDTVIAGDWLLSLEAMKIEHRVVAPAGGEVGALYVVPGMLVHAGQVLLDLQPFAAPSNQGD